tara:strand:- start:2662 stop:3405 length:744 start_codon:yes stop_codon:yes gene_type:complete
LICNTKAIVLNQKKYSDTSLICNLYSENFGKISLIAKGARAIKNPAGALLEPLNHIDLVYYYKPKRNIQLLKEGTIIKKHYNISNNYNKTLYALTISDIINFISYHDSPCNIIYRLLKSSLYYINITNANYLIYYYLFFKLQLLIYLGYQPSLNLCYFCNTKIKHGKFDSLSGQLACNKCAKGNTKIDNQSLSLMKKLTQTHIKNIEKTLHESDKVLLDIKKYLFKFIIYHLPELKKSKAFITFNTN